jgi:hypothetical protein
MGRCEVGVLNCMTPLVHAITYIRGAAIWHGRKKNVTISMLEGPRIEFR